MAIEFAFADPSDLQAVQKLLEACDLPAGDIAPHLPHFLLARQGGELCGVAGVEIYGEYGLLRSVAVAQEARGTGLGRALCERMVESAGQKGVRQLYLLTETGEGFFSHLGFVQIARESAPAALQETQQFRDLYCASAVCMMKSIV